MRKFIYKYVIWMGVQGVFNILVWCVPMFLLMLWWCFHVTPGWEFPHSETSERVTGIVRECEWTGSYKGRQYNLIQLYNGREFLGKYNRQILKEVRTGSHVDMIVDDPTKKRPHILAFSCDGKEYFSYETGKEWKQDSAIGSYEVFSVNMIVINALLIFTGGILSIQSMIVSRKGIRRTKEIRGIARKILWMPAYVLLVLLAVSVLCFGAGLFSYTKWTAMTDGWKEEPKLASGTVREVNILEDEEPFVTVELENGERVCLVENVEGYLLEEDIKKLIPGAKVEFGTRPLWNKNNYVSQIMYLSASGKDIISYDIGKEIYLEMSIQTEWRSIYWLIAGCAAGFMLVLPLYVRKWYD